MKQFTCYNQLATLMFGQLSGRESLRDVVHATQAHASKTTHLGFGKFVTRSNLSKANNNRDYRIFEEFAYQVVAEARVNDMNAMDVIPYEENSFYIFDRGYNDFERLYRINVIGAYFVVRGKKNNDFKPMKWTRRFPPGSGILSDAIGYMNGELTRGKYPERIRRITYWDEEEQRKFIFFTNALDISPMMGIDRPIYEMLQLVSVSLTDKTTPDRLFGKPNYNIVNELDSSSEPTLF